jgi:MFS family permease
VARAGAAVRGRGEAVIDVMRNPDLRRIELGWGAFFLVEWITLVGLSVWAFGEGGAAAVGIIGLARWLPGAFALPFGAWAADRFPRQRIIVAVFFAIAAVLAAIVVAVVADAPAYLIYGLTALSGVVAAPYRPTQLALAPLLAHSPQELVAANVTSGTLEGLATLLGPLVAGLLLVEGNPSGVLALAAAAALGGLVAVAGIHAPMDPSRVVRQRHERPVDSLLGGLRELRREPDLGLIIGCFVAQLFVRGVLGVLLVAVSFDLLDLGSSGVGWLGAAMGVGGLVGAVLAVTLTGRRRLGRPFALGLVLWGLPIAVIGLTASPVAAFAALAVVGIGNSVLDVAGLTLLQRIGDDRTLGRLFGLLYAFGTAMAALGSILAPALIAWLGVRPVLVATGALLPLVAVAALPRLHQIDARSEPPSEPLGVIAAVPLLSPLPPTTLEKIASRCSPAEALPGEVIVKEGASADRFYAIASGQVEVSRAGVRVNTLGAGDYFGEIALLRSSTRTATVTATRPTRLVTLSGRDFLDAIAYSDVAFTATLRISEERSPNA